VPPDTSFKPAWETFGRPTGEKKSGMWYFPSHSWDKAALPPGQIELLPCKKKKKKT
jgi:hypothetical protein